MWLGTAVSQESNPAEDWDFPAGAASSLLWQCCSTPVDGLPSVCSALQSNGTASVTRWEKEWCSEGCGPCTGHWWTAATTWPQDHPQESRELPQQVGQNLLAPASALKVQGWAVPCVLKSNSTPSLPILPPLSTVPVSQFRILTGKGMSQCTEFHSNSGVCQQKLWDTRIAFRTFRYNKGENTRLISAVGDVRHDQFLQGRRAVLDTANTEWHQLGLGHCSACPWGTATITPLHCLRAKLMSSFSPRTVFVQTIQTRFLFKEQALPMGSELPSSSTAIQGLWSWVSPQLLKALPWKPDPASSKVLLVLESISPAAEKQRLQPVQEKGIRHQTHIHDSDSRKWHLKFTYRNNDPSKADTFLCPPVPQTVQSPGRAQPQAPPCPWLLGYGVAGRGTLAWWGCHRSCINPKYTSYSKHTCWVIST